MNYDPNDVITWATNAGWPAPEHQEAGKLLIFRRNSPRQQINVYYSTGTIGTAIDHPRLGATQMFRRGVSPKQLRAIMANPRIHTNVGYRER